MEDRSGDVHDAGRGDQRRILIGQGKEG